MKQLRKNLDILLDTLVFAPLKLALYLKKGY